MKEFKIGDRVRVIDTFANKDMKNKVGTVVDFDENIFCLWEIGVEFDEKLDWGGHSCDGKGKQGFCRWGLKRELELVEDRKIVITTDGKETLARLYDGKKVIKTATAKCSRNDAFDFNTGARLAFERLFKTAAEKKEKYYNGKVVCIRSERDYFTVGKVYEFVDGQIEDNVGDWSPVGSRITSIEEYNGSLFEFIPFVE
jgi:hypothetical protein